MPKGKQNNVQVTLTVPRSLMKTYLFAAQLTGKTAEHHIIKALRQYIPGRPDDSDLTETGKPPKKKKN